VLSLQANEILTAVCKGIKDNNNDIKLAALNALYNALEFVKANFEKEVERNYIMQVVCESAVCNDTRVRVASMENLVKIAGLYYDKLVPYMQKIFNVRYPIYIYEYVALTYYRLHWKLLRKMKKLLHNKQ
jgi:importin subunit beta-1